jgi:hypothetical protein
MDMGLTAKGYGWTVKVNMRRAVKRYGSESSDCDSDC